jgi:vacuolar protein sorting-associated protein 13A/C
LKNTTTAFEKELDRQRLPRFIGTDGIVRAYNAREAQGYYWLQTLEEKKYSDEEYRHHLELHMDDLVVLITSQNILMMKKRRKKLDWKLSFEDLQLVKIENGGVTLIKQAKQQQSRSYIIPCPDPKIAKWLSTKIEEEFIKHLNQMKMTE